jgi:phosphomannomutase
MVTFSRRVRANKLLLEDSSIIGRFGFSITEKSVIELLHVFYNFTMNCGYKRVCLGQDGTQVVDSLFLDVIIPVCSSLGIKGHLSEYPLTENHFSWFCSESKKTSIGLYFSSIGIDELIKISIYENGMPLDKEKFKLFLKTSPTLKIYTAPGYEQEEQEFFNLDGYFSWLKDNKLITLLPADINIDTMFGSSYYLLKSIRDSEGIHLRLFNIQSEPPRLKNYIAKPTGQFLKWYTSLTSVTSDHFFFGIDTSASSMGVYDLKQKTEISSSGVALLLLKYLKDVKKMSGAFIVGSHEVNSKVAVYAKKLGFTYQSTAESIISVLEYKKKGKRVDLFINGNGGFYFGEDCKTVCTNPLVALFRIVEICKLNRKSPGELLDEITETDIKKLYYHNNFFVLKNLPRVPASLSLSTLKSISLPETKSIKSTSVYTIYKLKDKSRVIFKDNQKEGIINIYIETLSESKARELGDIVNRKLKELLNEN